MAPAEELPILLSTGVGELLERYPELEDILIGMAPAFRKLKNPILRKSLGRIASLRQAAAVGSLPVADLVNRLRRAVGQEVFVSGDEIAVSPYFGDMPAWFDASHIATSLDERGGDPNKMPIGHVLKKAHDLRSGEILELITAFLPAPGIDILKKKGFVVWTLRKETECICTYISKPTLQRIDS